MKPPCGKSCPKRTVECKKACPDWAIFEAWKFAEYERKRVIYEQESDYYAYHIGAVAKVKH